MSPQIRQFGYMTAWSHTIPLAKKPWPITDLQLRSCCYGNLEMGTKLCGLLSICVTCMLPPVTFHYFLLRILLCRENSLSFITATDFFLLVLLVCPILSSSFIQYAKAACYRRFESIFLNKKLVCFSEEELKWGRNKWG